MQIHLGQKTDNEKRYWKCLGSNPYIQQVADFKFSDFISTAYQPFSNIILKSWLINILIRPPKINFIHPSMLQLIYQLKFCIDIEYYKFIYKPILVKNEIGTLFKNFIFSENTIASLASTIACRCNFLSLQYFYERFLFSSNRTEKIVDSIPLHSLNFGRRTMQATNYQKSHFPIYYTLSSSPIRATQMQYDDY